MSHSLTTLRWSIEGDLGARCKHRDSHVPVAESLAAETALCGRVTSRVDSARVTNPYGSESLRRLCPLCESDATEEDELAELCVDSTSTATTIDMPFYRPQPALPTYPTNIVLRGNPPLTLRSSVRAVVAPPLQHAVLYRERFKHLPRVLTATKPKAQTWALFMRMKTRWYRFSHATHPHT